MPRRSSSWGWLFRTLFSTFVRETVRESRRQQRQQQAYEYRQSRQTRSRRRQEEYPSDYESTAYSQQSQSQSNVAPSTPVAHGAKKEFAQYVLLSEANWNKEKLISDLLGWWNINAVEKGRASSDTLIFDYGVTRVSIFYRPKPVAFDLEEYADLNDRWEGAKEAAKNHKAHLLVNISCQDPNVLLQTLAGLCSRVISVCCRQPTASAVFTTFVVMKPAFYIKEADKIREDKWPTEDWVWCGTFIKREGYYCAFTYGLTAFGMKEIEVIDLKGSEGISEELAQKEIEALGEMLDSIVNVLLTLNRYLKDEDVLVLAKGTKVTFKLSEGVMHESPTLKFHTDELEMYE